MKHYFGIFATSGEVKTAVEEETLNRPYVAYVKDGSIVDYDSYKHDYSQDYLTFEIISGGNITWSYYDDEKGDYTDAEKGIQYSKNNGSWTSMPRTLSVVAGDVIQFKGDNTAYGYDVYFYNSFSEGTTAAFNAKGNIMSLISSTGYTNIDTIETSFAFCHLFANCSGLIDASNLVLPATNLADYCYDYMFEGCTSLTTAPELPATILVEYCYEEMFYNCTNLTQAPELPATALAEGCYNFMFYNCTSLTTAPELPATTLADSCYQDMFYGCTSLTQAPELPATTLAPNCYASMFQDCTSLTQAPELPATTLANDCYAYMFNGCTSLNYIKCLATDRSASRCTFSWVDGVAATGTFVKDPNMSSWTTGNDGIPSGWNVQDA